MPGAADLEDPEGSPALPSGSLAAAAASADAASAPGSGHDAYGEIWRLAWPVTLGLVLMNVVSLVDVAMVGRLGPKAVAAVGYATQFHFLSQSVLFAVGFACVALMARAIGSGDLTRARRALAASLGVALATAAVIVGGVLAAPRLWLLGLGAEAEVIELAIPYLNLVLGSSLFLAIAMTIENGMRACRDTRTPMAIAAVVSLVKISLNLVLIFGGLGVPALGLAGAGLATLVAQLVGLAIFAAVIARAPRSSPLRLGRADLREARRLVPDVVRISLPGLGERLAMNLALLAYFRVLAEYGTEAIAAYTVGIRLLSFSWLPGSGLGAAASTLVGHALGQGAVETAARTGWRTTRLAFVVAIVLGIPCALLRDTLARLFVDDAATVEALVPFLLCLAFTQPFLQSHFALGGAHRGAGDTWTPFLAAAAGNWLLRLPLACLFTYALRLPLVWVWYALLFDHITRATWLAYSFRRGRWQVS